LPGAEVVRRATADQQHKYHHRDQRAHDDLLLGPDPGQCRGYPCARTISGRVQVVPGVTVDRVLGTAHRLVCHGWMIRC